MVRVTARRYRPIGALYIVRGVGVCRRAPASRQLARATWHVIDPLEARGIPIRAQIDESGL